jgi:signal transduction histidine kinase
LAAGDAYDITAAVGEAIGRWYRRSSEGAERALAGPIDTNVQSTRAPVKDTMMLSSEDVDLDVPADTSPDEVRRLRGCLNDLVSIVALPAAWAGSEPTEIVGTLLDTLLGVLALDFVYARFVDVEGLSWIEMLRCARPLEGITRPRELGSVLDRCLGHNPLKWGASAEEHVGTKVYALAPARLGMHAELGVIVAGCQRAAFPAQSDQLALNVAANQAAVALQGARALRDQRRVARELDQRVAQRTAELAAANEELKREVAERQRAEGARRAYEDALELARTELAHAARVTSLGVLTASIVHEVSQPLSGIITNASTCLRMLAAEPPNIEGARKTASRTIRDGTRASEVLARLRALFGKKERTTEAVDLNEATQEVVALSLSRLQSRGVVVQLELAEGLPLVSGDRVQLQQVILNLISNAYDSLSSSEEHPRQLLIKTVSRAGGNDGAGSVDLAVQDSGAGFGACAADKLFEAFYTTKKDGMGIGLSVSRTIIEGHGGRLWAVANEGRGVTFWFSIPRGVTEPKHSGALQAGSPT